MRILTIVASVLVVLTLVVYAALEVRGRFTAHGDYAVAADFASLARMSEVIVIGVVSSEGGTRNTARNPNDTSREDPNRTTVSQDYAFSVEEVLKGDSSRNITITSARSGVVRSDGRVGEFVYDTFIPLRVGTRYVLLLRSMSWAPGIYSVAFEPGIFELGAGAQVRSTWPEAGKYFPATSTDLFLSRLRSAVSAEVPSQPGRTSLPAPRGGP